MSSDSDDESLQKIKDKHEGKPGTININDSTDENCGLPPPAKTSKKEVKKKTKKKRKTSKEPSSAVSGLPEVSVDRNSKKTKSKPKKRSSTSNISDLNSEDLPTPSRSIRGAKRSRARAGAKRATGRGQKVWVQTYGLSARQLAAARVDRSVPSKDPEYDPNDDVVTVLLPARGRGRSRGRTVRGRGRSRGSGRGQKFWIQTHGFTIPQLQAARVNKRANPEDSDSDYDPNDDISLPFPY